MEELQEIENIIRDIGNSTRYKDTINGVDVEPILWCAVPSMCAKAILKWHNKKVVEARKEILSEIVCDLNQRICKEFKPDIEHLQEQLQQQRGE